MGDRGPGQAEDWVSYEELPEDAALLSLNSVGGEGEPLLICQSEDGVIGTVSESTQGSAACVTRQGTEDTFYVLILDEPVDDDYEAEDEAGGDLAQKFKKKVRDRIYSDGLGSGFGGPGGGGLLPAFDWTEEEVKEIREALEDTDAWNRFLDKTEEDGRWGTGDAGPAGSK